MVFFTSVLLSSECNFQRNGHFGPTNLSLVERSLSEDPLV